MRMVKIHQSGSGADKLRVESWGNGTAIGAWFGEAGSPMRNLFFQDDDAVKISEVMENLEYDNPDTATRELWFIALDPYL